MQSFTGGEQMEYNPAVTLISFKNLHSLKSVSAFLSLAPKFGIWSPQLNWGSAETMAGSGDYRWIAEDEQTDVYGGF